MAELIKVLIVDDHKSMRDSFESEFCAENGFEVVGSVASAVYSEVECRLKRPDLVIMDVCTEGGESGLDAAVKIRKNYPGIKIIVTSGFDEITYAPRAKELGAHAFIYKSDSLKYFSEVARLVLDGEYRFPEPKKIPLPIGEAPFTDREMEILRMRCKHQKAAEIAEKLNISERTVQRHIENMLSKTGAVSSLELVIYVVSNGWINPNY